MKKEVLEIYFSDLKEKKQKEYMKFYNVESKKELMGLAPLTILRKPEK